MRTVPELKAFPKKMDCWRGMDVTWKDYVYEAIGADATFMREYACAGGESVGVYMGFHGSSKGGRPTHSPQGCFPAAGWTIEEAEVEKLDYPGGETSRFNHWLLSLGTTELLVRYWFQSGDTILATGTDLNLFRIKSRLLWRPYYTTFVRLDTIIKDGDIQAAEERLDEWMEPVIDFITDKDFVEHIPPA